MQSNYRAVLVIGATLLAAATPAAAQPETWDNDGDGRISRSEWAGNSRRFSNLDRNADGYLERNELPPALRDRVRDTNQAARERDRSSYRDRDTRSQNTGVDRLDRNNSGVVEGYEWPYNKNVFHNLDRDRNSVLSRDELANISNATMITLDKNNNQRVEPEEWPGGFAQFDDLDKDRNGTISSAEYFDRGGEWQRRQRFRDWDKDRNNIVSSTEWRSRPDLFHKLDRNGDGQLNWDEFMASTEVYDRPFGWDYLSNQPNRQR
ncbi:MAG: EF-hand domain-containing protein [Bryobacterales bacterium]|nr:EF-hand domain-containing protein [Bryobacterales bacterium]